jgi:LytS/YehU family sensor histidine kinase
MSSTPSITRRPILHVAFWIFVSILWFFLRYQEYATNTIAAEITLLKVAVLAASVYFTNYFLIPNFLYKKKYIVFFILFLLMILTGSSLKVYMMSLILDQPELLRLSGNLKQRLYENAISDFFLVSAGAAVKLVFDYLQMQQRFLQLAKEKAEAELGFLKSQINPHFLFNSLNAVYFLIDKENKDARQALHKFSEMLRYQLYEANGDKIPLEKEIGYLKDYVDLQQLRLSEQSRVHFECLGNTSGFQIEPLLLIPFAENAFKHISHNADGSDFVNMKLERLNGGFVFTAENSKEPVNSKTGQPGGIGLVNVKRRLELLYPGKHDLLIRDSGNTFFVQLKIDLS